MKIISKFKDYYDFVAGYDTDPRKVFVRDMKEYSEARAEKIRVPSLLSVEFRGEFQYSSQVYYFIGQIWFCDQMIVYLKDVVNNRYYFDYNTIPENIIQQVDELIKKKTKYRSRYTNYCTLATYFGLDTRRWNGMDRNEAALLEFKNVNKNYGQPIYFSNYTTERFQEQFANGRLADIRFSEFKSPQDTFTELYNWIPFIEPEMPSDPTDMSRFENKGFDKIISFRNIK